MFFYMTRFPLVYERLTAEIRSTFANTKEVHAGQQLTSCRYLRAFVDETMRMNPPVSGELSREVMQGGFTVDGHVFKEGTNVGVSPYSLHHNESMIQDPFVFRPERWILDEKNGVTAESIAALQSAFYPFSCGPRACPGKNLAYLEMTITMAKLLYLGDVRAVEGSDLGAGRANMTWGRRNKKQFQTLLVTAIRGIILLSRTHCAYFSIVTSSWLKGMGQWSSSWLGRTKHWEKLKGPATRVYYE